MSTGTRMSTGTKFSTGLRYVHRHAYVYRYRVMYAYLNLDNIDPCAEVIQVLVLVFVSTTSTTAVFNF